MLVYIYDGYWEGLLTAVYEAYARHVVPDQIVPANTLVHNLLDHYVEITTDSEKAAKVARAVRRKISALAEMQIDRVFRADLPDKGTMIYQYLRLGFRYGRAVDDRLHEEDVFKMKAACRRVNLEVHRFEGLLRFAKADWGTFYARYTPDHHITDLLAPHFAKRLADQNWIIHDTRRNIAALYNQQTWLLTDQLPEALTVTANSDPFVAQIWQAYFKNIVIKERINPRLQRQMMPARYWQNLTEMDQLLIIER